MQGVLRTSGKPAKIKLRATVKGLPAGAEVEITDFMFQPDQAVSGWLPHVTELPWSAGMTYLNTAPGGEMVYWDDVQGKPVVFPPSAHKHSAADTTTGVFDPARIPALGASHIGDNAVTLGSLSLALQDLLDQYQSTIASLQSQMAGMKLPYRSKLATDAPSGYSIGVSTGLFSRQDGWPNGTVFWTVVTFRGDYSAAAVQHAYPYKAPTVPPQYRTASSGSEWAEWENLRG